MGQAHADAFVVWNSVVKADCVRAAKLVQEASSTEVARPVPALAQRC